MGPKVDVRPRTIGASSAKVKWHLGEMFVIICKVKSHLMLCSRLKIDFWDSYVGPKNIISIFCVISFRLEST